MKAVISRVLLLILFIFSSVYSFTQSAWNNNSFRFTRDTISLQSMSGATNVTFSGSFPSIVTSGLINFPGGFVFRFGLKAYTNFAISPYGFLRLGNNIINNQPDLQDEVIVPIYNGTSWSASYKITGTAPNRKFLIAWTGTMQPSGEPTSFQLWLTERTGKIEFVYESIRGFYGFNPIPWHYKIFCKASILQQSSVAALQVVPNNAIPVLSYSTIPISFDSIYAKTRYAFQPDTVKPLTPSSLSFTNIMAGCLDVQFNDNSNNESLFQIERTDDLINYFTEKKLYITNPSTTGLQIYNQKGLQPFWNYGYRVFASNGFLNSDTILNTVQTLMPQITGIKQIPGDYPSITSLLLDAECKHLGPDLVIELKNTYQFSAETLPVAFGKKLQNRLINSITIRPAPGATINWTANINNPIFYVDSVKHVFIDGRAGGVGGSRNFTIRQDNPNRAAVHYTNKSDSGGIKFCNIISMPYTNNTLSYSVIVNNSDSSFAYTLKNVNGFTLSNCYLASNVSATSNLVYIYSGDTTGNQNFNITNNEFSRFRHDAIYIENGGNNGILSGNHFYQPEPFAPFGFLPINNSSCIKLINTEMVTVSDNFLGGATPVWGQGVYTINLSQGGAPHHFIHYQNTSLSKKAYINNNKFGNITCTDYGLVNMIYASGGDVTIDGNRVGTTDSLYSITGKDYFLIFYLWFGTKIVTNNFFSGIHGQYPNENSFYASAFAVAASVDTAFFGNNDFGGSNNPASNTSKGHISCIYGITDSSVLIKKNEFHGITSREKSISAIDFNNALTGSPEMLLADSNNIHHLIAGTNIRAIDALLNSSRVNRISNNNIYALQSKALFNAGNSTGGFFGIYIDIYDYFPPPGEPGRGEARIYNNKIHSFKPIYSIPGSVFTINGIYASAYKANIYNNDIRFGKDVLGQNIDTANTGITGISAGGSFTKIEHNSVYIGGRGFSSTGISGGAILANPSAPLRAFITNNIIQIDRENINPPSPHVFETVNNATTLSAKNLWYSSVDPTVPTLLQAFKQSCNCDFSSFVGDPKFINPTGDSASFNLGLLAGSLADSSGTPSFLNIATDIIALSRANYSPVDIGSHAATPCAQGSIPAINIIAPLTTDTIWLCSGGSYTIVASITGGSFQQLQWQKNLGDITGANATSLVVNSPGLYRLVGKKPCMLVTSRIIVAVNGSTLQPSVSITASVNNICAGTPVTFTALPVNQGSSPLYQWRVNGGNVGTNSAVFTSSTLTNNSQVNVLMTNTNSCAANPTATSNTITMTVNTINTPSVNIAGGTIVVQGQFTTIISTVTFGGPSPLYQWQDSTAIHTWQNITGQTTSSISYSPAQTGNKLRCIITSNANCASPATVTSNTLTFTVNTVTAINPVNGSNYGIRYYPNPVNTVLFIDSLKLLDKWQTLEIKSIDGKSVIPIISIVNRTTTFVNVDRLPGGLYIAVLRRKNGIPAYLKFVKQ
jgi:hypothetical protein